MIPRYDRRYGRVHMTYAQVYPQRLNPIAATVLLLWIILCAPARAQDESPPPPVVVERVEAVVEPVDNSLDHPPSHGPACEGHSPPWWADYSLSVLALILSGGAVGGAGAAIRRRLPMPVSSISDPRIEELVERVARIEALASAGGGRELQQLASSLDGLQEGVEDLTALLRGPL